MSDRRFALEVFKFGPGGFDGSLMFATPQVTIGRDPRSTVHLEDPTVSLRHAMLEVVGDSVSVRDLRSRAGTLVNGRPITGEVTLKPTDELQVGVFRLRLAIHRPGASEDEETQARPGHLSVPTPLEVPVHEVPVRPRPRLPSIDEEVTITGRLQRPETVRLAASEPEAPAPRAQPRAPHTAPIAFPPLQVPPAEPRAMPAATPEPPSARQPAPAPASPSGAAKRPVAPSTVPLSFSPGLALGSAGVQSLDLGRPEWTAPSAIAASPAPSPPILHATRYASAMTRDDDDEDDENEEDFVPPFDLLRVLTEVGSSSATQGPVVVEAIHFRGDRILAVRHAERGRHLRIAGLDLGACDASGSFVFAPPKSIGALAVRREGEPIAAEELEVRAVHGLSLERGMQAVLRLPQGDALLVQVVPRAPVVAPSKASFVPMLEQLKSGAASAGVHLLLLLIFGLTLLRGKTAVADDVNEGRFATVDLRPIELEPPPPPPDPPTVEKALSNMPHASRAEPTTPGKKSKTAPHATDAPPPTEEPSKSAQNILKALGGGAAAATPDISALSNVDAMPRGRAGFRVSDAVGKGPGDTLRVAVGNADGTVNTKSAAEVGNVGKLDVKPGSGAVRARVTAVPAGVSGEGTLDRGAIQKVVNAHLYQVQGCYERQLAANPGLAGKATLQWTIQPSGGVGGVRIAQSSIASVEVMSCIQAAIRGWSFPKPEGGSVTVTYPFAFSTFGN